MEVALIKDNCASLQLDFTVVNEEDGNIALMFSPPPTILVIIPHCTENYACTLRQKQRVEVNPVV